MLRSRLFPLAVGAVLAQGAVACTGHVDDAAQAVPDTAVEATPLPTAGSEEEPTGDGCIRGGTPRADVRRIMGEPDSVAFGSWLYGASEVMFGYGVVVEIRNQDGNLVLC